MAFETECPSGWEPYAEARGRFILGDGTRVRVEGESTGLGDQGGRAAIPGHRHGRARDPLTWTPEAGGTDHLPPYVVLTFCRQE